ncbi:MAG: class II fructose-bisphosphate aldolase [Caldilinea sp.]|jgi:ketose-bisphosphate aldolase|uniref:class II fructose-bisphosphate aldolase n=1 Tax=Caldilinea sp. TaxID=2293560 RepID=UPI0030A59D2B
MKMTIVEWMRKAYRERWAIGQFNISNLEVLQAVVTAANENSSPAIVGVSMGSLRHIGLPYLAGLIQGARRAARAPIFFHLDHGVDFATVKACIEIGFDSVMLDASRASIDENIRLVREVVNFAHAYCVGVEAQLGETWDEETGDLVQAKTDPNQVKDFVEQTGIDYLAISFGNTPGRLEGTAEVDTDLVRACAAASPVPIVLHGGSSITDESLRIAIASGAAKVNIDTAIRCAVSSVFRQHYADPQATHSDPRKPFAAARQAVQQVVSSKMHLLGSVHRAN